MRSCRAEGELCVINSAAGRAVVEIWFTVRVCPVAVTTQKFSSRASVLLFDLPAHMCMRMCVAYFCLYVCVVCVCMCVLTVSQWWKMSGSSSSFGTRGNMTQMATISANRLGPAAQDTQRKHANTQLEISHTDKQCVSFTEYVTKASVQFILTPWTPKPNSVFQSHVIFF